MINVLSLLPPTNRLFSRNALSSASETIYELTKSIFKPLFRFALQWLVSFMCVVICIRWKVTFFLSDGFGTTEANASALGNGFDFWPLNYSGGLFEICGLNSITHSTISMPHHRRERER